MGPINARRSDMEVSGVLARSLSSDCREVRPAWIEEALVRAEVRVSVDERCLPRSTGSKSAVGRLFERMVGAPRELTESLRSGW